MTGAAQQTIAGAWRSETPSWWTTAWTVVFDVRGNSSLVPSRTVREPVRSRSSTRASTQGRSTSSAAAKTEHHRVDRKGRRRSNLFSLELHQSEPVPAPSYDTGEKPGEIIVRRVSAGAGRPILDRIAERRRLL